MELIFCCKFVLVILKIGESQFWLFFCVKARGNFFPIFFQFLNGLFFGTRMFRIVFWLYFAQRVFFFFFFLLYQFKFLYAKVIDILRTNELQTEMFAITLGYPVAIQGELMGVAAVNVPVKELIQLSNIYNVCLTIC